MPADMIPMRARDVPHLLSHEDVEWEDGQMLVPYALIFPLGSTLDWRSR